MKRTDSLIGEPTAETSDVDNVSWHGRALSLTCSVEVAVVLLEIIQVAMEFILSSGDLEACQAAADHVHNLPDIIADYSFRELEYYWQAFVPPTFAKRHPERWPSIFEPWWGELRSIMQRRGDFDPDATPEWWKNDPPRPTGLMAMMKRLTPAERWRHEAWEPYIPPSSPSPARRVRAGTTFLPGLLEIIRQATLNMRTESNIALCHAETAHVRRLPALVLDCDTEAFRQYWNVDRPHYLSHQKERGMRFEESWANLQPFVRSLETAPAG